MDNRQYGKLRSCEKAVLRPENFPRADSRPGYCPVYCLFWALNVGYFIDSIDWIDSALGT